MLLALPLVRERVFAAEQLLGLDTCDGLGRVSGDLAAALHGSLTSVIAKVIGLDEHVKHVALGGDDVRRSDGAVLTPCDTQLCTGTLITAEKTVQRLRDCIGDAAVERAAPFSYGRGYIYLDQQVIDRAWAVVCVFVLAGGVKEQADRDESLQARASVCHMASSRSDIAT